jgi:hypothetical protein
VNINSITATEKFASGGDWVHLGEASKSFRTILNGHLNSPGTSPTGWFGGYAVPAKN